MAKQTSGIESLIEKLSLYDLWNYFFTGGVFYVLIDRYTSYGSGTTYNIWWNILLCGFVGMLINRIGSIFDKILNVCKERDELKGEGETTTYREYINASYKDAMIEIFWNRASFFRSSAAMLLIFTIVRVLDISPNCACNDKIVWLSFGSVLLLSVSYFFAEKTLRRRIHLVESIWSRRKRKILVLSERCNGNKKYVTLKWVSKRL